MGTSIRPLEGQLVTWWGILVPIKKTIYSLSEYSEIELVYERQTKSSSSVHGGKPAYVFRIYLKGESIKTPVTYYSKKFKAESCIKKIQSITSLEYSSFIDSTENYPQNIIQALRLVGNVFSGKRENK
jgi:hypothetical protein